MQNKNEHYYQDTRTLLLKYYTDMQKQNINDLYYDIVMSSLTFPNNTSLQSNWDAFKSAVENSTEENISSEIQNKWNTFVTEYTNIYPSNKLKTINSIPKKKVTTTGIPKKKVTIRQVAPRG